MESRPFKKLENMLEIRNRLKSNQMCWKKISLLLLLSFCSFNQALMAQDLKTELKKIQLHHHNHPMHCELQMKVYGKEDLAVPLKVTKSMLKRDGNDFLYEIEGIVMLYNEHYSITYNRDKAVVFCNKKSTEQHQQIPTLDFSSMLEKYETVSYKGNVDGDECYILKQSESTIPVIEFYFKKSPHQISKIVYHYDENLSPDVAKVEMNIHYVVENPRFTKKVFSEKQFIEVGKKGVRLQPALAADHLVLGDGLDYAEGH